MTSPAELSRQARVAENRMRASRRVEQRRNELIAAEIDLDDARWRAETARTRLADADRLLAAALHLEETS